MRKKILSIILTTTMVLGLIPCIPCVKQVKAESSWKLVWSDEFDGDSLNTDGMRIAELVHEDRQ